jgi:hypothetical protein
MEKLFSPHMWSLLSKEMVKYPRSLVYQTTPSVLFKLLMVSPSLLELAPKAL